MDKIEAQMSGNAMVTLQIENQFTIQ